MFRLDRKESAEVGQVKNYVFLSILATLLIVCCSQSVLILLTTILDGSPGLYSARYPRISDFLGKFSFCLCVFLLTLAKRLLCATLSQDFYCLFMYLLHSINSLKVSEINFSNGNLPDVICLLKSSFIKKAPLSHAFYERMPTCVLVQA